MHSRPIVIASVAGTVINRLAFGDVTEFVLPVQNALGFYVEFARVPDPWAGLWVGRRCPYARDFLG